MGCWESLIPNTPGPAPAHAGPQKRKTLARLPNDHRTLDEAETVSRDLVRRGWFRGTTNGAGRLGGLHRPLAAHVAVFACSIAVPVPLRAERLGIVEATDEPAPGGLGAYRRDGFTWAAFGSLAGFGFLNAVLGPALPFLRASEQISYVVGALHQAAFAIGGGIGGLWAARSSGRPGRAVIIRAGLVGAAAAGLGVAYGNRPALSIAAALLMSLLGSSAVIRLWAALSDTHHRHRAVVLTEGEVAVSLGGILTPLMVSALAASVLGWRSSFLAGAALVVAAVAVSSAVTVPSPRAAPTGGRARTNSSASGWSGATLVVVAAVVGLEFSLSLWLASYLDESVGLAQELAVAMVAALYAANLVGRVVASRLARRMSTARLLALALVVALAGLPILLSARDVAVAAVGLTVAGAGIGALFPLASTLHVQARARPADAALGEVLVYAAVGQVTGPLVVAGIAQAAGLRVGLLTLPVLTLLAAAGLARHISTAPPPT